MLPVLGLIALAGGVGLAVLSAAIVYKQVTYYGSLPAEPFIYVTIFSMIALFCLVAGFRLIFFRKDRAASIMPPIVWSVLGSLFLIAGIVLLVERLFAGEYSRIGAPGGFLSLSVLFFIVANHAKPSGPDDPQIL
jgi:hypothetical protein